LDVVDSVGLDGLTIRAVAAKVGAPPMSLYTHFSNKDALLDLMCIEISQRLYCDSGHSTWQAEIFALAGHYRRTILSHPRWTTLLARPALPATVPARERILQLMVDDGLTPAGALQTFTAVIMVSLGLVLSELAFRPEGQPTASPFAERFARWKEVLAHDEAADPATRAAFNATPRFEFDSVFELSVRTLIDGLSRDAERTRDALTGST
jgi:TetR/AcrR family transcriptional regulator, tetracycline repressor protein